MNIVLISPYELGRQPFALAHLAAWLKEAEHDVQCIDLSLEKLEPTVLSGASMVAVYVAMHTATRIAAAAMPRIRVLAPTAHIAIFGLYAPMNEALFRSLGAKTILGGEVEPRLVSLAGEVSNGGPQIQTSAELSFEKISFRVPDRTTLPELSRYAHLNLNAKETRVVGFAEGSRGCKHLCRHCPVVPVYKGKFRIVPVNIVLADIRQQVAAGAEHISFGDPDFLNGPKHALRLVRALHEEFPGLTYDATIKVEHIIKSRVLLPELKRTGCLFVVSAVEAVDEKILSYLDKNHSSADFDLAVSLLREVEIAFAPTFVAFTPWTSVAGYIELLQRLVTLQLVESVPPIQLAIRLLIPSGSYLLKLPGFGDFIGDYDPQLLGYPWKHSDAAVDALQREIQSLVERAESEALSRQEVFAEVWALAHAALHQAPPELPAELGRSIPHMSEPWYCCAEPTGQQLQEF